MRIAALGDIHGNLPAFEQVLANVRSCSVDEIWCHGDICYGGPWPKECAEVLRAAATVVTRGNTDDWVCAEPGEVTAENEGGRQILEIAGQAGESIGGELRAWLRSLKIEHQADADVPLVLTHATRRSHWAPIPDQGASDDVWLEAYGPTPATIVCGHNHVAFVRQLGSAITVVNTGSVGAPGDGDWRASFLLIDRQDNRWSTEHIRVEYDREATANAFATLGHVEGDRFAYMIRTGNWPRQPQNS